MSCVALQLGGLRGCRLQFQFARNQPACTDASGISLEVGQGFMTSRTGGALQDALLRLMRAIAAGEDSVVSALLAASPALATARVVGGATRQGPKRFYLDAIGHYLYADETPLHVAAAAYQAAIARKLIQMGADVRARNRLGAEPLHYAVIGMPGSRAWNPAAQAATVAYLIEAGADPNAIDKHANGQWS